MIVVIVVVVVALREINSPDPFIENGIIGLGHSVKKEEKETCYVVDERVVKIESKSSRDIQYIYIDVLMESFNVANV